MFISKFFTQITYTVSPTPINPETGMPDPYPAIQIVEPPKISGVLIIAD